MYSALHSHLTAVAIDFFFFKYTLERLDCRQLRGRCRELPLSGQRLQFTHVKIRNEKRINSNNLLLRTEACLKSFGGDAAVYEFLHCSGSLSFTTWLGLSLPSGSDYSQNASQPSQDSPSLSLSFSHTFSYSTGKRGHCLSRSLPYACQQTKTLNSMDDRMRRKKLIKTKKPPQQYKKGNCSIQID